MIRRHTIDGSPAKQPEKLIALEIDNSEESLLGDVQELRGDVNKNFYGWQRGLADNKVNSFTPVRISDDNKDQVMLIAQCGAKENPSHGYNKIVFARLSGAKTELCKCSIGLDMEADHKTLGKVMQTPPNSSSSSPLSSLEQGNINCQCSSLTSSSSDSLSGTRSCFKFSKISEVGTFSESHAGFSHVNLKTSDVEEYDFEDLNNLSSPSEKTLRRINSMEQQSCYKRHKQHFQTHARKDESSTVRDRLHVSAAGNLNAVNDREKNLEFLEDELLNSSQNEALLKWIMTSLESRDSDDESSSSNVPLYVTSPPILRIRKSTSLVDSKPYKKNKKLPAASTDEIFKYSTNQRISSCVQGHVTSVDDVIKSSKSFPNHLNRNSKKERKDWRSIDRRPIRTEGKRVVLDEIMDSVKDSKKCLMSIDESRILSRKMKKTIKNLFNITPKLHKNFKRGLYLVSVLHQSGKVLVTNENVLPAIEVRCEETPPQIALKWDFNWFSKILCNWSNVRSLKRIFEKPETLSDSMQFRFCLIRAAYYMQKITGVENLGTLHYQILTEPVTGSQVFLLINTLSDDVKINTFLKWCSVRKLARKRRVSDSDKVPIISSKSSVTQQQIGIMSSIIVNIPELISFNTSCFAKLHKGLYLGYVKLSSFIDQLRIMVARNMPNVFPFVKIRDDHKVSRDEWESLVNASTTNINGNQEMFRQKLFEASRALLSNMGVAEKDIFNHRVYTSEVFEFNYEVSFILLIPNNRNVCSRLGEEEKLKPGYMTLPLHQFEIYHMSTYHTDLTRRYTQVSALLEAEVNIFNHLIRQGISDDDELKLRERINQLNVQQKKLDETWKSMRWISEVISNARDGRQSCGLSLERIKPQSFNQCTNLS